MKVKRPFGVNLALSFFTAYIVVHTSLVLSDLDLRLYHFVLHSRLLDLIFVSLSVLAVIGLMRVRTWGWVLAIVLAGLMAGAETGVLSLIVILRLWTLLPVGIWQNIELLLRITFAICTVWYLLRLETRSFFHVSRIVPAIFLRAAGHEPAE